MSEPWEPFDRDGSPVRGEVLCDVRAAPDWLRRRLATALAVIAVSPIVVVFGSGVRSPLPFVVCGAVVVVLDVAYAAWWRATLSRTRLRITTAEVVLDSGPRRGVRLPVADVEQVTLLPRGTAAGSLGAYATVRVHREADGAVRSAKIFLPTDDLWEAGDAIDAALELAQAPFEGHQRHRPGGRKEG